MSSSAMSKTVPTVVYGTLYGAVESQQKQQAESVDSLTSLAKEAFTALSAKSSSSAPTTPDSSRRTSFTSKGTDESPELDGSAPTSPSTSLSSSPNDSPRLSPASPSDSLFSLSPKNSPRLLPASPVQEVALAVLTPQSSSSVFSAAASAVATERQPSMIVKMKSWLDLENFRNGFRPRASNTLATYTEFPPEYRPGANPYALRLYDVAQTACKVFVSLHPSPDLVETYLPKGRVQFPVHPVNMDNDQIPHIREIVANSFTSQDVRSTSSTRTVFVLSDKLTPHCLKPHTNLKITRWRRHMEMRKVEQAVAITRILEKAKVFEEYPKVGFFPESIGAVYAGTHWQDWGFIVREMESKPYIKGERAMVPFCSLYVPDSKGNTILEDLILKSKKDPKAYILEEILFPLLTGWAKIYLETGVLLEPHGQNIVVEMDPKTNAIVRFVHRDFDCELNKTIAEKAGISTEGINERDIHTTMGDEHTPPGSRVSVIFDNSVKVPMEEMAELALKKFKVPKEEMRQACRAFLRKEFPELVALHFPAANKKYKYVNTETGKKIVEEPNSGDSWR